jgi:hypothetical protein
MDLLFRMSEMREVTVCSGIDSRCTAVLSSGWKMGTWSSLSTFHVQSPAGAAGALARSGAWPSASGEECDLNRDLGGGGAEWRKLCAAGGGARLTERKMAVEAGIGGGIGGGPAGGEDGFLELS